MDKVLIVEDNPVLLKILQTGLRKYSDRFEAITARDGEEAINVLAQETIAMLVTDLQMPKVDGLTLLAYMNDHHPEIPCVVMSAHGTPQIKERISQDVLSFIEKPFEIEELVEAILPALSRDEPAGTLNGISIANFLQMIHMEQKTCLLEIETHDEQKGYFYFEEGVLFDAVYEELNGEEAAMAIIPQERAKIRFKNLAKGRKKVSRRIERDLMALLMDAMRIKDEAADLAQGRLQSGDAGEAADIDIDTDDLFSPGEEAEDDGGDLLEGEGGGEDLFEGDIEEEFDLLDLEEKDRVDEPAPGPRPRTPSAAVPEPPPPPSPGHRAAPSDMNALFDGVRAVRGYQGAAALDDAGEVLLQDSVVPGLDLELFAAVVIELIHSARRIATDTQLGSCKELILTTDRGALICASAGGPAGESFHALVLLAPDGNRALAKIALRRMLPSLEAALA